ncbi:MAG: SMC family ATPase [Thermoplasmata archaeon]
MQLRGIRLRNIRSYDSVDLPLRPGRTLLAGDVGSGKSSLLYAVEMAFFGTTEVDAAFLIRHGAIHAEVAVTLEGDGHRYEIVRRIRRTQRKGREAYENERLSYGEDGVRTAYSVTELRQRVIDLFGFPDNPNPRSSSELWRWAVYVPQEQMREVLTGRPDDRLRTVRKALGLERYRLAAENAELVAARLRAVARDRQAAADRLEEWETALAQRAQQLDALEAQLLDREAECARAADRHRGAEARLREASAAHQAALGDERERQALEAEEEADRKEIDRLSASREAAERRLAALRRAAEAAASATERREALEGERSRWEAERAEWEARLRQAREGREALERAEQERRAADERVGDALRSVARTAADVAEAEGAVRAGAQDGPPHEPPSPTPKTLEGIDAELADARHALAKAREDHVAASRDLDEWSALLSAGICPRCQQPVRPETFAPHRAEAEERLRAAETSRAEAEARVRSLEEERRARERYERVHGKWQEAERRRAEARRAMERATSRRQEAEEGLARARERLAAAVGAVEALADWRTRAERTEAEWQAWQRGFRGWESAVETVRDEERRAQEAQREQSAQESLRGGLVERLRALEARREARQGRLADLRSRARELAALEGALREAQTEENQAQKSVGSAEVALASLRAKIEAARQLRAEAEQRVRERFALRAEVRALEERASWLRGPFREAVLTIERTILSHAQGIFQQDFARYFRALLDDPLLEARIDPTFTPSVLIQGADTPAEALSGGERTGLALAYRLALGRLVRTLGRIRLDLLMLDEPTDGFSPEQITRMGELLDLIDIPQVLLVSHEFALASVAEHVIEVRKVDGRSVLSVARSPGPPAEGPEEAARPGRARGSRRAGLQGTVVPEGEAAPDVPSEGRPPPPGEG